MIDFLIELEQAADDLKRQVEYLEKLREYLINEYENYCIDRMELFERVQNVAYMDIEQVYNELSRIREVYHPNSFYHAGGCNRIGSVYGNDYHSINAAIKWQHQRDNA